MRKTLLPGGQYLVFMFSTSLTIHGKLLQETVYQAWFSEDKEQFSDS